VQRELGIDRIVARRAVLEETLAVLDIPFGIALTVQRVLGGAVGDGLAAINGESRPAVL